MSFRSTFYSPGGFTTQRLDLILKKRKDDGPGGSPLEDGGSPTSPTSSSTLEENIRNKHVGALDRWRQKMAAQNTSPGGGSSGSESGHPWSGSKLRNSTSSLDNDSTIKRTSSLMEPRRKLEFSDTESGEVRYRCDDDNDYSKEGRRHSLMNLPRRRKEQSRDSHAPSGVNGVSSSSTARMESMGKLNRKSHMDNDLRGSRSHQALSTERPLTSRRFQELFSTSNSKDKDDENEENYPDSLEGDASDSDGKFSDGDTDEVFSQYGSKTPGSSLTRSLSSASNIFRTGWSPSGRLMRDRYNIPSNKDELKSSRNVKGTPSNWATWKGGIGVAYIPKDNADYGLLNKDSYRRRKDQHERNEDPRHTKLRDDSSNWQNGGPLSPANPKLVDQKVNFSSSRDPDGYRKGTDSRGLDNYKDPFTKQEAINKAPSQCDSVDSISTGNRTGGLMPEAIPEVVDLPVPPTMPPLPTSLHMKSFPGFVQSSNWGQRPDSSGRRIGHWAGHVPTATSDHKPPEWYLYKGFKSEDLDQSRAGQQELGKHDQPVRTLDFLFHDTDENQKVNVLVEDTEENYADANYKCDHDENDNLKLSDDYEAISCHGGKDSHISADEGNRQASHKGNNDHCLEGSQISGSTIGRECETGHDANLRPSIEEKNFERDYRSAHNTGNSPAPDTKQGAFMDHDSLLSEIIEDISGPLNPPTQKVLNKDQEAGDEPLIDALLPPSSEKSSGSESNKISESLASSKDKPQECSRVETDKNKTLCVPEEERESKQIVESESAKSPRVSFSDDLKVVPPSPSAKRKQWPTSASDTNSEPTTTAGPRPWDKSGKTPVKGILQNGRKEGDVILKPEPDNSEMRRQDTDEEEPCGYINKRHSFSTSRDMSTRQRYATFMNEARQGYKPKQYVQQKNVTPNTDRKLTKVADVKSDGQSSNKLGAKGGVKMRDKTKANPPGDRSRRLSWREDEYRSGYRERSSSNTSLLEQRDKSKKSRDHSSTDPLKRDTAVKSKKSRDHAYTDPVKHDSPPKSEKEGKEKDTDASGFTLSFKDFMEHRKKQGTMVLPKLAENTVNIETRNKGSRDVTQKTSAQTSGAVTLNTLKQKRMKELEAGQGSEDINTEDVEVLNSTAIDISAGEPVEKEQSEFKSKSESLHRWSFRSKSKKKEQDGAGRESPSTKKKEPSGGAVQSISNFFKRSKKGKKDKELKESDNRSVFYGENHNGATDSEGSKKQGMGTSGDTVQDTDDGFNALPSRGEQQGSSTSFTLGPHGHDDNSSDPLSVLFTQSGQSDFGDRENNEFDSGLKRDTLDSISNINKSPSSTRPESPALSAISSSDGSGLSRNKHYQKPDYKHFLDMDSLVASITTNSPYNEAESSSGVSGTGSDSASVSGIGSLEDLAMALLEQELREEGLLEGEPGKGDPSQNYQDRILSIKSDLQKFSAHLGRALKKHHKHADSENAPSVSEVSFTSTRSSRYGMRDPTAEAKPVTDPLLRSKLKTARSPGAKVTSRDQKILELMMQKRESERAAEAKREALRRAWETEKEHETAVKSSAEVRRRQSLVKMRNHERDLNRRRDSDIDRKDIEDALKYKESKWASQSQRIVELREKKMAERRMQSLQRKKSQEERLAQQKREQEEMARLVKERQDRELKRANSLKESKEQEAIMTRKLKSYYHKKKVDSKLNDIKRKSREDVNSLQAAIEMKQATAQSHINELTQRRNHNLRRSTTDLDTRISRSRENQQKLQAEMSAWHEDLLNYRKSMARKAEEQAKALIHDKAKRAAIERKDKEKAQRDNLKKLLDQEDEWKADVEATIAMKDARTKMIQMEKEETVQESRAMAAASQRMREELRSAYSSDNIDQLSRRAEIEAKIGLTSGNVNPGITGTTKNMSTLTLG